MWMILNALGALGGLLLVVSLYALFVQYRSAPEARTGLAKLPKGVWIGGVVLAALFIFLGLNSTAFAPGPDQEAIDEDIKAFDAEFDDLE